MKKGSIGLIISVTVIFFSAFSFMNYNFDPLSRYPYQNEEHRRLIKQYLSDEEIEYIIEYSIAPSLFIDFIKDSDFNIYHATEYYELSKLQWNLPSSNIVKMVEETREYMSVEVLNAFLIHYSYSEVYYWLKHGDEYNPNSNLVINAGDMSAYVDDNNSISIRTPFNLQRLNEKIPTLYDNALIVDVAIQKPLIELCNAISNEGFQYGDCGGLLVENAYISYQQQKSLYDSALAVYGNDASYYEFYPGHSEHQLGLAVDFVVDGVESDDFVRTNQSFWLENNAYRFGFIQTYSLDKAYLYNKKAQPNHYRYVGVELAKYMYDNNLSLKETLGK